MHYTWLLLSKYFVFKILVGLQLDRFKYESGSAYGLAGGDNYLEGTQIMILYNQ